MPGVITSTEARAGSAATDAPRSAQYAVVGLTERGPLTPTTVTSYADYVDKFGARVTYGFLTDDLQTFFREGGARALVKRVVGAAATVGTLTLKDAANANALRLDATSPGAWSAGITVEVTAGTVVNGAATFSLALYNGGALVNRYSNLATVAAAVDALSRSTLLTATDLGGAIPKPAAATALSAGTDDRATVDVARLTGPAGLAAFTADYGAGAVAIPGYSADLVAGALIDHGNAYRRVALLHGVVGATQSDIATTAAALLSASANDAGLFYPWVTIPGPGLTPITVPPTGYVAAVRSRAHADVGAWAVPAGDVAKAQFVTGLAGAPITEAGGNALDAAHVSVIRAFGSDIELYGYRSLSTNEDTYRLLSTRDATNVVVEDLESISRKRLFGSVDAGGAYFQVLTADYIGYLDPIRSRGGLFALLNKDGDQVDPGYSVVVNSSINTLATLARNQVYAEVGLRWSPVAETIVLKVTTVGITVAF